MHALPYYSSTYVLRQSYLHISYHDTKHDQNLNTDVLFFLYATKITVFNKRKVYLKYESVSFAEKLE